MGVWELCDGRTPGIPEVISQFEEKRKSALLAKPPVRADAQAPRKMFTVWEKQSSQRFTTGILTQRETHTHTRRGRRCERWEEGGGGGELWSPGDWKKEGENRSGVEPGAGRAPFHAAQGTKKEVGEGGRKEERHRDV